MGKGVTVQLDKRRTLRFDLNAVSLVGDELGIELRLNEVEQDLKKLLDRPLPLSTLRTLLWAALLHEDPELTAEAVGAMVDADNIGEVMQSFFGLFGGKLPDQLKTLTPNDTSEESPLPGTTSAESGTDPLA